MLNLTTAKALGPNVPETFLLFRADTHPNKVRGFVRKWRASLNKLRTPISLKFRSNFARPAINLA